MKFRKPDGYRDLLVYKRAEELRLYVRKLTEKLPFSEKRRIVHLNDSARSVKQNIVEGWKRVTTNEYYDFLSFSLGSLAEIKEDIKDLSQDGAIREITRNFFVDKCQELDFLLNRLRQSLFSKMEEEGTLPIKERLNLGQKKREDDILDKIIAESGLIRQENGRYVKSEETGKKGEREKKGS